MTQMKWIRPRWTLAAVLVSVTTTCAFAQTEAAKPADKPVVGLAGGASAITETHGSWTVNCQIVNAGKLCSFSHQKLDNRNQRIFALELSPRNKRASGTAALPFGLDLGKGISVSIDGKPLADLQFRTCVLGGCLVSLDLNEERLALLVGGETLAMKAFAIEDGREMSFDVPLFGFSSALNRTTQLLAD